VRACPAGTELERSPVIVVPEADLLVRVGDRTVLDQYLLYWSDEPGRECVMGGGLLMFYNHSDRPNVEFRTGPEPETMSVVALRDVAAGEELTYDYGITLWFTPAPPGGEPPRTT
jgi:SET domain-containing protein